MSLRISPGEDLSPNMTGLEIGPLRRALRFTEVVGVGSYSDRTSVLMRKENPELFPSTCTQKRPRDKRIRSHGEQVEVTSTRPQACWALMVDF